MPLKLMYIANDPSIALIACKAGVDRIFIDLEINNKAERQRGHDTVISRHHASDIKAVRKVAPATQILCRINPLFPGSATEIENAILYGADVIMLPMYTSIEEVGEFLSIVAGRAATCLLLENSAAVKILDATLQLPGIDEIFIGLNDLHLSYGMKFMFEPLANGMIDRLAQKIKEARIPFGFGGIGRLGFGTLPAEKVLIEHYRLGSRMVILSRSFCGAGDPRLLESFENDMRSGIKKMRRFERIIETEFTPEHFAYNKEEVREIVSAIIR